MPLLLIIAGPNGAGKTTFARRRLPGGTMEFVNADLIAAALSPDAPDQAAYEAGRILHQRLRRLAAAGRDLAFETTLAGRSYAALLRELRGLGYRVRLDFLWIPELGVARDRVSQRVQKGGHPVPERIQQRRFHAGIRNLLELYRPLLDEWRLYDNTGVHPRLVAREWGGALAVVDPPRLAFIERATGLAFVPVRPERAVEEPAAFTPDEISGQTLGALRRAFADAVLENLAWNLPVIQWREDRGVVAVPSAQLAPFARCLLALNGDPLPPDQEQALLRDVAF